MRRKARITYEQFRKLEVARKQPGTVANLIERFIVEMNGLENGKPVRMLGASHCCTLRCLQRAPIGMVMAKDLTKHHVIDHCKARLEEVVPATINQDVGYLNGVLKYAPSAWDDCDDVSAAPIEAAKPFLTKHNYIAKSNPRKRVPTDEEIAQLTKYFSTPPKVKNKTEIYAMPDIIAFALVSTRRVSEICRITHSDIDWERKDESGAPTPMYMVRDLKHPTHKKGNDKWFCLFPELAEIIKRQPRLEGDDRVFPFNAKSVGAKYTRAKKTLGIHGLRFHDNRREAITRWLAILKNPHQVKLISGHNTISILERNYDASDPALLHKQVSVVMGYRENNLEYDGRITGKGRIASEEWQEHHEKVRQ